VTLGDGVKSFLCKIISTEADKYGQVERGSAGGICMPTLIGSGGGGGIWTGVDKTGH